MPRPRSTPFQEELRKIVSANLNRFMDNRGWNQIELSEKSGIPKSTINGYIKGTSLPTPGNSEKLAKALNVEKDKIDPRFKEDVSADLVIPISTEEVSATIPIYGVIPAGYPSVAEENIIGDLPIPDAIKNKYGIDTLLGLMIIGDSMNKVVPNGYISVLHKTLDVKNGDIVGVMINGYDATLKRVYKTNNSIILEPDSYNPDYRPVVFDCTDLSDCPELKIIGKYIWSCAPIEV